MTKCVIFDMDGIIVDSEPVYLKALNKFYACHGMDIPMVELHQLVGASGKKSRRLLEEWWYKNTKEDFDGAYKQIISAPVDYKKILFRDTVAVLQRLKKKYRLGLASSSPMNSIEQVITSCGLQDFFDTVVSGEMFHESKPNPEIYQYTMKQLDAKPDNCLAVEDSHYGILAAKRAGLYVIARRETRFQFDQSHADIIADDFLQIEKEIYTVLA